MRLHHIAGAVVALWALSAVVVTTGTASVTPFGGWLALAVFSGLPAFTLWLWANDPGDTMNAGVHRIRDEYRTPPPARH
jgi:hypothetical protein